MAVNNLVSIVQIYCRHLFLHTKWEICQLSVIKVQNIFDDGSGMCSVLSKIGSPTYTISFGLEEGARNSCTLLFLVA